MIGNKTCNKQRQTKRCDALMRPRARAVRVPARSSRAAYRPGLCCASRVPLGRRCRFVTIAHTVRVAHAACPPSARRSLRPRVASDRSAVAPRSIIHTQSNNNSAEGALRRRRVVSDPPSSPPPSQQMAQSVQLSPPPPPPAAPRRIERWPAPERCAYLVGEAHLGGFHQLLGR